ncbi:glycosyltransferase [Leptospira tipperaryensis]|nr:glycosyltransferase [Leptospira tipperaryensis]
MYRVWSCQALEASKDNKVTILLNKEHWAVGETFDFFREEKSVSVETLFFPLPEEYVNNALEAYSSNLIVKILRKVIYNFLSFISAPFFILQFVVRLRKIKPDVIYCHSGGWPGGRLSRLLMITSKILRIRNRILILHNFPAKQNRFIKFLYSFSRFIQRRTMEFSATEIVAVSDSLKKELEEEVFSRSLKRVYNGIPIDYKKDEAKHTIQELKWIPKAKKVVGFIGSLAPPKAPHTLVEAFQFVTAKSELALLGPGDPNYIQYLKNISFGYKNPVTFLGFHDDVNQFLKQIDLLVVPSAHFESFGMAIIESMRMKKPVICTDFGGMKEVVVNGKTGIVVPAGDAHTLGKAIDSLLMNPKLSKEMGLAGYDRFIQEFTSSKMNSEYEKLCTIL